MSTSLSANHIKPILLPAVVICWLIMTLGGSATAATPADHIEIIEISGNLDRTALNFLTERIDGAAGAGASAAIVQIDSRATLSEAIHHLVARLEDPPLPLVVWVGPNPATAFGGAARILAAAPVGAAAPGVSIGHATPAVAGYPDLTELSGPLADLAERSVTVTEPIEGLVDFVAPSINNLLVELEGHPLTVRGEPVELNTVRETEGGGIAAIETVFHEPGITMRTLRISTGAEQAFSLLMIGLAVAAFEFYALGPGIAAGVAALCLLMSGYGLAVLPLRGWAVGLALLSAGLLTADFQRGRTGPITMVGAASMLVAGLFFTDAAPQIRPSWLLILVIVISVTAFYVIGMRTVARARFSTPTIGRDHMVGLRGLAITGFDPDGIVEVNQARWKAAAHREAGIDPGDPVVVGSVDGQILRVEPDPDRTTLEQETGPVDPAESIPDQSCLVNVQPELAVGDSDPADPIPDRESREEDDQTSSLPETTPSPQDS